ncbi:MAG TPA: hypothetical protein VMD29_01200 [Terracidiphilus sp.]|nr:hypothetical protein [Terracidiphilus sp.]
MKEQNSSSLDQALECVPQDRRKFLAMLLAGIVAAPLVATTALAGDANGLKNKANKPSQKPSAQKAPIKFKANKPAASKANKPVKNSTGPHP